MTRFGIDDVRGAVIGPISHRYSCHFRLVEQWPNHGYEKHYPMREHGFWSELPTRREAIAEYIAASRKETKLGDGSQCLTFLERVCPICEGAHPMGCCAKDGHGG